METVEFRGCRRLVYAEITEDDNLTGEGHGYVTGTVKELAPVAEISKTVETSRETHFYDNKGRIIIDSEGDDTVTLTIAIPPDSVLADIEGRTYDNTKKMFIESERTHKYFALGYVLGEAGDGGDERLVWRYKGMFGIPEEKSATKDKGTGANNMSLTFTGIYTDHIFTNGKGSNAPGVAKASYVRTSDLPTNCTEAKWFQAVSTPDTTWSA